MSYRHLMILGWICISFEVIAMLTSFGIEVNPNQPQWILASHGISEKLGIFALPLFLLSNFAIILGEKDAYKMQLLIGWLYPVLYKGALDSEMGMVRAGTNDGFGDVTANTQLGRIISVVLGAYGIIVVALITSIIVNYYGEMKKGRLRKENSSKEEEQAFLHKEDRDVKGTLSERDDRTE